MSSDVRAIRVTAVGLINVGPARIRGIHVLTSAGVGRLTFTNGVGGDTVLDAQFDASDTTFMSIPDAGIRCEQGMVITAFSNITSITVFFN